MEDIHVQFLYVMSYPLKLKITKFPTTSVTLLFKLVSEMYIITLLHDINLIISCFKSGILVSYNLYQEPTGLSRDDPSLIFQYRKFMIYMVHYRQAFSSKPQFPRALNPREVFRWITDIPINPVVKSNVPSPNVIHG